MNSKGFTLVELIATIALLSIIVTISFISINAVIKQGKVNDCETLVGNIKTATKEYVSDNRYNSDFIGKVIGMKVSIDANTLIDNNYLTSPIYNPFTKEKIDSRSIKIDISLNDDYTISNVSISEPAVLRECKSE